MSSQDARCSVSARGCVPIAARGSVSARGFVPTAARGFVPGPVLQEEILSFLQQ